MNCCALQRIFGAIALGAFLLLSGTAPAASEPSRLSQELRLTLEEEGVDATEELYRWHRERGFVDVRESRADTAALGYQLLKEDQMKAAVLVFRLNAETYPESPSAMASLGDAYSSAGDRAKAADAYRRALMLDSYNRSARYGLARLNGRILPPLPSIVLLHIFAGVLSILAGAVAMVAPKGRAVHRAAGKVFVAAMIGMAGSAVARATQNWETETLNFWMGTLTLYLVTTGWRAARFRVTSASALDWGLPIVALVAAFGLLILGVQGGSFAGPAYVFCAVATLAGVGDVRWFRQPPSDPNRRIVRHLWRIGLAMFIAVGSFFLGQPHVFPLDLRTSGLLIAPPLAVAFALVFWGLRYRLSRRRRHVPKVGDVRPPARP